jgi:hypothetical protein
MLLNLVKKKSNALKPLISIIFNSSLNSTEWLVKQSNELNHNKNGPITENLFYN